MTIEAERSFELDEFLPVTVRSQLEVSFHINIEKCASNVPSRFPDNEPKLKEVETPSQNTPQRKKKKNLLEMLGKKPNVPSENQEPRRSNYKLSRTIIDKSGFSKDPPKRNQTLLLAIPMIKSYSNKSKKPVDESPISSNSEMFSEGSSCSPVPSYSGSLFNILGSTPNSNFTSTTRKSLVNPPQFQSRSTHVIHLDNFEKNRLPDGQLKLNQYTVKGLLGCGAFGKVFKAVSDSGETVAIKIYNKRLMRSRWVGKRKTALSLVYSEITIMESITHENIIKLYEVIDKPSYHKIYLVIEYAAGNSLYDKTPIPETKARKYFKQLIGALEYLHETVKVVHRDIKPQNLLIDHEDNLKICDFGSAQFMEQGRDEFTNSAGTFAFMAPELHGGAKIFKGSATDIWAAGITLFYMILGRTPYNSRKSLEMSEEVKTKDISIPSEFPKELRELLKRIFDKDPNTRATLEEIKNSEWYNVCD